jgi:putative nucleotidyltransferase with HDIG domain
MKQRILFVEDNPILAKMYEMMFEREAELWEVVTAPDAEQAVELMARSSFGVIVSDMGLPGMSGIELIDLVRRQYPACSRIILSGLSDQEEVVRSLNATHQFLAKPVSAKALKATLARIGSLDACLSDKALRSLVGELTTLPSFPSLYIRIMEELGAEEPSIDKVAKIILQDPSMTAKLLQIANSAALGLERKLSSPFEAVQQLGLSMVRSLVLSVHIFSAFKQSQLQGFSIDSLWAHSMRTATVAQRLMQHEGAEQVEAEEAYIAGMLHDIGKLMLANSLPEKFQQALALAAARPCSLPEAEVEVLGANHAGVAAYLLGLWGLPATIVEAVAFHHTPSIGQSGGFGALTAVHAANVFEHESCGSSTNGLQVQIDADHLASLGLLKRLEAWRAVSVKALIP